MRNLFKFENKLGYSEIISFIAILLSISALWRGCAVEKDNRALSYLDLRPHLRLNSFLKETQDFPAHFTLYNAGPVDAVQVEIQLSILGLSTESKETTRVAIMDLENPIILPRLGALNRKSFKLPLEWLINNCKLSKPPKYSVVEILVKYLREADRKLYAERAFYFLNPDNRLVTEYDNSLHKKIYKPIIKAAHRSTAIKMASVDPLNELNPIPVFESADMGDKE